MIFFGGGVLGHGFLYVSGFCNKLCFKHVYPVLAKSDPYGGTKNSRLLTELPLPGFGRGKPIDLHADFGAETAVPYCGAYTLAGTV